MNDRDLDRLLKSIRVPSRTNEYWTQFPGTVSDRLQTTADELFRPLEKPRVSTLTRWLVGLSIPAAASIIVALFISGPKTDRRSDSQLTLLRESYQQAMELFPQRLEAIVIAGNDAHISIADQPAPPRSEPLFVRICPPKGPCVSAVSFSGTRLEVSGREFEILEDGSGQIFVVAKEGVWAPGQAPASGDHWRIESGRLEQHL